MWVTAVIAVIVAAAQMYMQYNQAQAEASAARRNAKVLNQQAALSMQIGEENAARQRRLAQQRLSEIRAGYAKGGVTPEGTPLLVESEAAKELELEALTEKWKGQVEGINYSNEAAMERWRARQIKSQGTMKMISTGLSAVSGFASSGAGQSLLSSGSTAGGTTGSSLARGGASSYRGYGYD